MSTFNPSVHLCPPRAPLLPATCSLDHRFLQRAPVVIKRTCKAGAGPPSRSYVPAAPTHTSPRPPLPPAPPPPSPGPSSAALSAGLRSLWHRIFQLPARFSGTFWLNFWSQKWGHRATPVLGPLLYFIPWVPKMGPPCDPKNGAQNFVIFWPELRLLRTPAGYFLGPPARHRQVTWELAAGGTMSWRRRASDLSMYNLLRAWPGMHQRSSW